MDVNNPDRPLGSIEYSVITPGGDQQQTLLLQASEPAVVTVTKGTHSITTLPDGSSQYTFSNSGGSMTVIGTANNMTVSNAVTIRYTVSRAQPSSRTFYTYTNGKYTPYGGTLYIAYSKSTLTIDGGPNDTGSGSATLTFTPSGGSENVFTYKKYTPEKTQIQKYATYLYEPSDAKKETLTVLARKKSK